ncbi:hypothetical protein M408DRAFT_23680 [Serendipita vermifera MAFF 305830]|uniref:Uncharacterized protein n=1 Tax=Serendipita vermifera MAFF 305830 TaxID=933852 RepID=A0A0C3BB39_SERVB|nr:hypothetical protein M408DRAFT_23680 [Serendipita vermifera MAFF 305830]
MSTENNNLEAGIAQPLLPPTTSAPRKSSVGWEICRIIFRIILSELWALLNTEFNGMIATHHGRTRDPSLRTISLPGYDTLLRETMYLGATGGAVLYPIMTAFILTKNHLFPSTQNGEDAPLTVILNMFIELGKPVAVGATAGAIGSTILRDHELMLDPEHAARAGALGGTVLIPGFLIGIIVSMMIYKRFFARN